MHVPFCFPNPLQWRWRLFVDLRFLNGWRIGPKRIGRTFVLLRALGT